MQYLCNRLVGNTIREVQHSQQQMEQLREIKIYTTALLLHGDASIQELCLAAAACCYYGAIRYRSLVVYAGTAASHDGIH